MRWFSLGQGALLRTAAVNTAGPTPRSAAVRTSLETKVARDDLYG